MEKFVLTPKEAAAYIGIGENKIRDMCAAGMIQATKVGRNWKIPRPMLERFIMEKAEKGETI